MNLSEAMRQSHRRRALSPSTYPRTNGSASRRACLGVQPCLGTNSMTTSPRASWNGHTGSISEARRATLRPLRLSFIFVDPGWHSVDSFKLPGTAGICAFYKKCSESGGESVGDARCVVLGVVAFLFPYPCADSPPDLVAVEWLRG